MPLIETIGDTIDREGWIKKLEARIDELENRGYCTRCSLLAFEERDKFKAALEHVIECADYEAHGIASEALGVPNPDETILGLD